MTPVAIVAGAGGGGRATSVALARRGYYVVILDAHPEPAEDALLDVVDAGGAGEGHAVDLLDLEATSALRADLATRLGRVDVIVHLVGGWRGSAGVDADAVQNWRALHPPIVDTLAILTAVFNDDLQKAPAGRAFMVTSTAASRPTAGNVAYASAKAAAEAWMAGLAHAWRDTSAASVVVAVKALLTDAMQDAEPEKDFTGYTHVTVLGEAIAEAAAGPVENGSRLDLTAAGYSPA
ncbi:MAG: SDR family NAD(P)-dependent oxidoreductase [Actinomycetales bacterium]|nr:SDR family NAD(P)-dependent oxidoreductase [Actinomycetales bacterium]